MLELKITSQNMTTDEIELERVIDHDNRDDRIWLGKHCFWAFRNGRSITTTPVTLSNSEEA